MTKQMTTLDRARVSKQKKQSTSTEAPVTVDAVDPEKVCQESIDDPVETCTTPNDPGKPTLPADEAA